MMTLLVCVFLGAAPVEQRAHYLLLFGSQEEHRAVGAPDKSHTFATWVECENDQILDVFTISWCAQKRPEVFKEAEVGRNIDLDRSLAEARALGLVVQLWGPYRISDAFFRTARQHYDRLEESERTGRIKWKCLDGTSRFDRERPAVNCIHAVSDTAGGVLRTGYQCGFAATLSVMKHFVELDLVVDPHVTHDWVWESLRPSWDVVVRRSLAAEALSPLRRPTVGVAADSTRDVRIGD